MTAVVVPAPSEVGLARLIAVESRRYPPDKRRTVARRPGQWLAHHAITVGGRPLIVDGVAQRRCTAHVAISVAQTLAGTRPERALSLQWMPVRAGA